MNALKQPEPFDIGKIIEQKRKQLDIEHFRERSSVKAAKLSTNADYEKAKELVKDYFETKFDTNNTEKAEEWLKHQHNAIIGEPKAIKFFKDEVVDFLRKNNLLNIDFPSYYHSISDAIFNDLYGLGPLVTWNDYPSSQAAHIKGKQIFFEIGQELILQPFEFDSIERVEELVRALTLKDPKSKINEYNPKLEVNMLDGTRVTMFIPPLSKKISITFRRFIIEKFSFEDQASYNTIPKDNEAVKFLRAITKTRPNTVIVGPVKSGKSTMLNTLYAEREHTKNVVCVEKHDELKLSEHYPGRPLDELVATEQELLKLFPSILRTDFIYLIVGELRSVEAELCMQGCERGSTGLLTTFHNTHPHNIPGQIARLILDSFPNRRYDSELVRVADNLQIVIVMEELPDKAKRVTSILELRLDPITLKVSTHEIMRYSEENSIWEFKFDLSGELLKILYKNDPYWANILVDSLKSLEEKYPLKGNNVIFANDSALISK